MSYLYRLQAFHDYKYFDQSFPTVKELLNTYGEMLGITRAQVRKMIARDAIVNRHPHILITRYG